MGQTKGKLAGAAVGLASILLSQMRPQHDANSASRYHTGQVLLLQLSEEKEGTLHGQGQEARWAFWIHTAVFYCCQECYTQALCGQAVAHCDCSA